MHLVDATLLDDAIEQAHVEARLPSSREASLRAVGCRHDPNLVRTDRVDRGAAARACRRRCRAATCRPRSSSGCRRIMPRSSRSPRRRAKCGGCAPSSRCSTASSPTRAPSPSSRKWRRRKPRRSATSCPQAERALAVQLLPRDAADERAAMLEVRAGTGGDEAALFAGDLLRMYQRFAETQGWRFELISASAVRAWRLQGGDRLDQRRGRVRQAQVRKRRPPRPARAGDRERRPHPHLGGDGRGAARGRGRRRPDRRQGPADRRLPLVGARRPVGQHHRQRRPHHPSCRPASSSSSRTKSRSTRTRPRR